MRKCLSLRAEESINWRKKIAAAKWQAQLFMQLSQNNNYIFVAIVVAVVAVPLSSFAKRLNGWEFSQYAFSKYMSTLYSIICMSEKKMD